MDTSSVLVPHSATGSEQEGLLHKGQCLWHSWCYPCSRECHITDQAWLVLMLIAEFFWCLFYCLLQRPGWLYRQFRHC